MTALDTLLTDRTTHFPVTQKYVYLDHAAQGPMPARVRDRLRAYIDEQAEVGVATFFDWFEVAVAGKAAFTGMIGAKPEEVAYLKNTSDALSTIAAGLPWQEGDNIICLRGEFPANVYPWLNLQKRGVEVRFVEPQPDNTYSLDAIEALMDERTRLMAVSYVEYGTGYRNDLAALAALCHANNALIVVDAIQGLGALRLDVRATDVDFLACGVQKWLLSPMALGCLYIKHELLDIINPVFLNWLSVENFEDFSRYDNPPQPTAKRFEGGSPTLLVDLGFAAAVDLFVGAGTDLIEARILQLTDRLAAGIRSQGYHVITPRGKGRSGIEPYTQAEPGDQRSGIVCFAPKSGTSLEMVARLKERNILASARGDVVRVSPHFYNTPNDVDAILNALDGE